MIRPFTALCILAAGAAGLHLYQAKHDLQMLEREIVQVVKQADATRERAGLLRAEYTLLNDPSRLADLASAQLPDLKTTQPAQFTTWADFEKHLPPVGLPPAEPTAPLEPDAPGAAPPAAATADAVVAEAKPDTKPGAVATDAARPDAAKPEAAKPVAAKPAGPAETAKTVATAPPRLAPRLAAPIAQPVQQAALPPASPRPAAAPVSLTATLAPWRPAVVQPVATRPAPPPSLLAARPPPRTMPTWTPPAVVQPVATLSADAPARVARAAVPEPMVGSALGMARTGTPALWRPPGDTPTTAR